MNINNKSLKKSYSKINAQESLDRLVVNQTMTDDTLTQNNKREREKKRCVETGQSVSVKKRQLNKNF
jgi:hypothetical protein